MSFRNRPPVHVGPVPVADATRSEVLEEILSLHREGRGARIATANMDFVALARRDPQLARDLAGSSMVIADGAPVAWLARAAGARNVERLPGCELPPMLIRALRERGAVRVAIYGSEPEVAHTAAEALCADDVEVHFGPVICPPFRPLTEQELDEFGAAIRESDPDIVLVALGCPKQERFIAEQFSWAPRAIWIGIGGTLDFYAGRRRRAPRWAQRAGMEWCVRLAQEPRRLWRRYVLNDIPALVLTAPGCFLTRTRSSRRV